MTLFVLKRVFRSPERSTTAREVGAACHVADGKGTQICDEAVQRWPQSIIKSGRFYRSNGEAPEEASGWRLLEDVEDGKTDLIDTGLYPEELPVIHRKLRNSTPSLDQTTDIIVRALVCKTAVEIDFVTMDVGGTGETERVYPIALERADDSWRLLSRVMTNPLRPLIAVPLVRITAARPLDFKIISPSGNSLEKDDPKVVGRVLLDPRLTEAQIEAMRNEFRLGMCADGSYTVGLNRMQIEEFVHRYVAHDSSNPHKVWPPFKNLEPVRDVCSP